MLLNPHPGRVTEEVRAWEPFAYGYEQKVISVTSFAEKRKRLVLETTPGCVADLGCGPLGLLARDLLEEVAEHMLLIDFSSRMISSARSRIRSDHASFVVADNRELPLAGCSLDTVFSVNSFLPQTREEVDLMFAEVARVLRPEGRLVAVLPAFEMSILAMEVWRMSLELDLAGHREFDTTGWQCFYTQGDIVELMDRHGFRRHRVERMEFTTPVEVDHVFEVYQGALRGVPREVVARTPLFEHLLVAER